MSASIRKIKIFTTRRSSIKKIRLVLLIAGVVLVFLGLNLSPRQIQEEKNSSSVSVNSISVSEPITIDKALLRERSKKEKDKLPPIRIVIPALSIDLPVNEAKIVNGYWELFNEVAGWGTGSAYPDEAGNQVIFAHAREGLFLPLKKAKEGQNITVFTRDKWFQYKISEIREVLPSQTEVIAPTTDETLTLYTCSGFSDSKRLIVIAKRI